MPTKSKAPAPVSLDQTASEAFATIMAHNFEYLVEWEETARSWEDIEGVHQFRVTIRRMRSALTLFQNAIPKPVTEPIGEEMRGNRGRPSGPVDGIGLPANSPALVSEGNGLGASVSTLWAVIDATTVGTSDVTVRGTSEGVSVGASVGTP